MTLGGGGNCGIVGIEVTGEGGGVGRHSSVTTTDGLHPFKLGLPNKPHIPLPETTSGLSRGLAEGSWW